MKSNKKCEHCGEFEDEIIYAQNMPEGENAKKAYIVSNCKNYEKCPLFNKKD